MISTLSDNASFITVSIGNEIRVRDGDKPVTGEGQRPSEKKTPGFTTDSGPDGTVKESVNEDEVHATVARLQETLKHVNPRIEISLEKDINRVIFRVVDKESGDLIRQIPPEKVVELDRFISGHSGLLVEEDI
jgi:flagellar protein FlaG